MTSNPDFKAFKIGHGYDVHRLTEYRPMIIGGINIPYHLGLLGHSDADVLLHAICDAVLGALGEGDIGVHFPNTDPAYKNISSMILAQTCCKMMKNAGYSVGNIDATIVAQEPKLAPFLQEIKDNVAAVFKTEPENVNIKATTEERLGFTGREEGISAHAVILIVKD